MKDMKDLKNKNIEKKKLAEQDKLNQKIGSTMGQVATGFVAASAIYASLDEQAEDDNVEMKEPLLAEAVQMPDELALSDNDEMADKENEQVDEQNEEEIPADEKGLFVAATLIDDDVQQEQDAPFVMEAESITDDAFSVADNGENIMDQFLVGNDETATDAEMPQEEVSIDEEISAEATITEENYSNEAVEETSEIELEFEEYEDGSIIDVNEVGAEIALEIDSEDESQFEADVMSVAQDDEELELEFEEYEDESLVNAVEVDSEDEQQFEADVMSVAQDEEVELEFEEYVDADDEYDSVSVLFDEDEENTLLSYEDNLEASRSGEDGIIDDDSALSDFENNADVSSFM